MSVTIWDDAGVSARPARPAVWEMALTHADDWRATWLAAESEHDKAENDAAASKRGNHGTLPN